MYEGVNCLVRYNATADFADVGRPVEIFGPGKYAGAGVFDEARIRESVRRTQEVANVLPSLEKLPIKLGHSMDPKDHIGHMTPGALEVSERGTIVSNDWAVFGDENLQKIRDGIYRCVSIEMYPRGATDEATGTDLSDVIRGVAITPHPRVRNIKGLEFAEEYEDDEDDPLEPSPYNRIMRFWTFLMAALGRTPTIKEVAAGLESAGSIYADGDEPTVNDESEETLMLNARLKRAAEIAKSIFGANDVPPEKLLELADNLAADEEPGEPLVQGLSDAPEPSAAMAELQAEVQSLKRERYLDRFRGRTAELVRVGKMPPAVAVSFEAVAGAAFDVGVGEAAYEFADAAGGTRSATFMDAVLDLIASAVPDSRFSDLSVVTTESDTYAAKAAEGAAAADKLIV